MSTKDEDARKEIVAMQISFFHTYNIRKILIKYKKGFFENENQLKDYT